MRKTCDTDDALVYQGGDDVVGFHRTGIMDQLPPGGIIVRTVCPARRPRLSREQVRRLRDWLTEVLSDQENEADDA